MFSDTDLRETKGSSLMWVSICCDMSERGGRREEGGGALEQALGIVWRFYDPLCLTD